MMTVPPQLRRLWSAFQHDDGVASLEFALTTPLLMAVLMASLESGLFMTRAVMLEQAVDLTLRELRIGHYTNPTAELLKTEICSRTVILEDCEKNIMIEMTRVSTSTWAMPTTSVQCVDRAEAIRPVSSLQIGQENDLMMVSACVPQDALFPTTGIGLGLPKDGKGGYGVIAVTAFVTEPN